MYYYDVNLCIIMVYDSLLRNKGNIIALSNNLTAKTNVGGI